MFYIKNIALPTDSLENAFEMDFSTYLCTSCHIRW